MMKMDMNSTSAQIVFQGLKALAGIALTAGIAIFFVENSAGEIVQSLEDLADASQVLTNFAG